MSIGGKLFMAVAFLVLNFFANVNHWGAVVIGIAAGGFALFLLSAILDVLRKIGTRVKSGAKAIAKNSKNTVDKMVKTKERNILDLDDDSFQIAIEEIESGNQQKGLWAKAFAISEGDKHKQKAVYLRLRAKQLNKSQQHINESDHSELGSTVLEKNKRILEEKKRSKQERLQQLKARRNRLATEIMSEKEISETDFCEEDVYDEEAEPEENEEQFENAFGYLLFFLFIVAVFIYILWRS